MNLIWFSSALLLLILQAHAFLDKQTSNLIKDFVKTQKFPTKVNGYLCGGKLELQYLAKLLNANGISFQINTDFDRIKYALPEIFNMYVVDMSCPGALSILEQAQALQMFTIRFRWLIIKLDTLEVISNLNFGPVSNVFLVDHLNITAIYKPHPKAHNFILHEIYTWKLNEGISNLAPFSNSRNRSNLQQAPMNIKILFSIPETRNHLSDRRFPEVNPGTKQNYILVHHLMKMLNVTVNETYSSNWGYFNTTSKKWVGLMAEIQDGSIEMAGTVLMYIADRLPLVDFTQTLIDTNLYFVFKAPPLSYTKNIYALPFNKYVWFAVLGVIIIFFLAFYLVVKWEWTDILLKRKLKDTSTIQAGILDVGIGEIGVITQQGSETVPHSFTGKFILAIGLLSLMFLHSAYSGNIVALLQSRTESLNSLEDLLQSRIKLGSLDYNWVKFLFQIEREPIRRAIYEQKLAPKGQPSNFMPVNDGIAKMRTEFFAFHMEESAGLRVIERTFEENEKCYLKKIQYFKFAKPAIPVKKNSSYVELVKIGFKRIHEYGIQAREYNYMFKKMRQCSNSGNSFDSIGLIDCYFPFMLFVVGFFVSFVIMFFEHLYARWGYRLFSNVI